jgi:hypothetical protein
MMLQLDALHRTSDRLDPKLRAKLRWVAADANRCAYSRAAAETDYRRAGGDAAELQSLAGDLAGLPENERAALTYARKLTVRGASVTDDDVKRVLERYGDRQVVAMVALIAHACFQDGIILALDPPAEPGGPPPPVTARFPHTRTPAGPPPKSPATAPSGPQTGLAVAAPDPEWRDKSFADLQHEMERQRARPARIRIPPWDEVGPRLPRDSWGHRLPRVVWNRVCYAHQPDLFDAWFDCVDAFRQEAKQDRVFQQDLFWVVTRANDCFY